MPSDKLKQLISKYDRPQNCENLVVPKVNQQILVKLEKRQKLTDLRFSHIQESVAVTKCVDQLLKANDKSSPDLRQTVGSLTDAVALLGHGHYEVGMARRLMLKPALNKEVADVLCSPQTVTSNLFGDDFSQQLKDIQKNCQLGRYMASPPSSQDKYHPKGSYMNQHRYRPYNTSFKKQNGFHKKDYQYQKQEIQELTRIKNRVSQYADIVPILQQYLQHKCENLQAVKIYSSHSATVSPT